MRIRRARLDEASALSKLALEAKSHWQYSVATLERWSRDLTVTADAIDRNPTFVAEDGALLLGFYMLSTDDGCVQLEHLWVSPAQMRKGVGTALMKHAVDTIRNLGGTELQIDADPNAEDFYKRCGAVRIGETAAPIAEDPDRVRPILRLSIAH